MIQVSELLIPETLDGPGGADFVEMVRVRNEIEAEIVGTSEVVPTAQDILPRWQDPYSPQLLFVARVDGHIVGRAGIMFDIEEGSRVADLLVEVLSSHRRRGIGSALYEALAAAAQERGRTVLQGDFLNAESNGPRLHSPTGFGSVPESDATRFAVSRGFSLQQVVRASRLALPFDASAALARAVETAGHDYRIETWSGSTPDARVDDIARLHARMSTDAPSADLEISEEVWDAHRVASLDALRAKAESVVLVTAAEHVPTGRLVAFSELEVPQDRALAVRQEDTLVLKENRGHGLGMLVKLANLAALENEHPGHPSVITFNAEENRPMLDVNEAIGFRAFSYEGVWKKG